MDSLVLGMALAFWLGILTSISPCPLAANIAAISFVGRRMGKPLLVLLTGFIYTLGRTFAYVVLSALLVSSLLNAPFVSHFLQKYMNKVLGPILIVVGMFLLNLIRFGASGSGVSNGMQKRVEAGGLFWTFALGIVLALSFCPLSAALFFGSLISLSVKFESWFLMPFLYGIGTGLPVLVFAALLALGAEWVGKAFNRLTQVEKWVRAGTGVVVILVGIYLTLKYVFEVFA